MKIITFILIVAAVLIFSSSMLFAFSVDYDGDGVADAVGSVGNVPVPPAPTRVDTPPSRSTIDTYKKNIQPPVRAYSAPKPRPPSTDEIISNQIMMGVFQGLLNEVFAPTPTGPTPEELHRLEQERILQEQKHKEFLKSNEQLSNMLKGGGATGETTATGGGLQLKLPSSGDTHRSFFGQTVPSGSVGLLRESGPTEQAFADIRQHQNRMDELYSKNDLSKAEQAELDELARQRNGVWKQVVSRTDLTQEERERLMLKMRVAPAELGDHPMVDYRALIEKERYVDPVLDVATAAAKAGVGTLGLAGLEEGGKMFLGKKIKGAPGFDELLSAGKLVTEPPKSTAEKTVAVIDYALTKAPSWAILVDAGINAVGAGTRQAVVRYWVARDSAKEWDPTPTKTAMDKYDSRVMDQGEWTKAALNRISMGEHGK